MAKDTLRIGIVGANWSLKVHGQAWQLIPNVEVTAVCTAHQETAEAAAKTFGLPKAYWNIRDMAADPDIDVIDIGSRPSYRPEMVLAALQGGKHVYDALPFAMNTSQAFKMSDTSVAVGKIGVVDAQFRWVPAAMHMKALVDKGFLGKPLGFNVQLLMPLMRNDDGVYPSSVWPGGGLSPYLWLADGASGGGAWRNFGSHTLLLLTHLLGDVAEVSGAMEIGVPKWTLPDGSIQIPENEDLGTTLIRLENGASGVIQAGWCVTDAPMLRFEIWGDAGRLLLSDSSFGDGISAKLYAGDTSRIGDIPKPGDWVDIPPELFEVPGTNFNKQNAAPYMLSMAWMFHDMACAIRENRMGSPSFGEAAKVHRVVEAALRSSKERRWIRVAEMI